MKKPIEGMKTTPYGEDYMAGGWIGLVEWLVTQDWAVSDFKEKTGHDIISIIKARGIDRMIDKATGHDREVITAWADYVTEYHWGIEGDEQPEEDVKP
jgi:hypothetical protein